MGWLGGVRAWMGKALSGRTRAGRRMELLEALSLGGRRQVMLVRCDGKTYLIGVGGDSVQSIVEAGDAVRPALKETGALMDSDARDGTFGGSLQAALRAAGPQSSMEFER